MLPTSNASNDYKLGERTQVKFCFTVKYRKYALALVNTINNANFESFNNFRIYCCDEESKKVMEQYNLPYENSFGYDVYNDKIINMANLSIENPDTAIIAIDAMAIFDFHKLRGCLGRLKYKDKTLYYVNYFDIMGDKSSRKNILTNVMLCYNLDGRFINKYLKCLSNEKVVNYDIMNKNYPDDSIKRYVNECIITEECLLKKYKRKLHIKHMTRELICKIKFAIMFCDGGRTLNYMIENKVKNHLCYRFDDNIFEELINA